jgi:putative transposase
VAAGSSASRSSSPRASTPTAGARCWAWRSAPRKAEPIWTGFLRKLTRRGLRGVRLAIGDAPEGIQAAVSKVLSATGPRCRVHSQRNAPAPAGKSGRRVVSALIATAFAQEAAEAARAPWRTGAGQVGPKVPKLASLMDGEGHRPNEHDVPACMSFPKEHRAKPRRTSPIEP